MPRLSLARSPQHRTPNLHSSIGANANIAATLLQSEMVEFYV